MATECRRLHEPMVYVSKFWSSYDLSSDRGYSWNFPNQVRRTIRWGIGGRSCKKVDVLGNVTIPPPDGTRIAAGDGTPTALGTAVAVQFVVQSKGKDVCNLGGAVMERITNPVFLARKLKVPRGRTFGGSTGWTVAGPKFYQQGISIIGMKRYGGITAQKFSTYPTGAATPFSTGTQEPGIMLLDACGNEQAPIIIAKYTVKWVRNPDCSYSVVHK